jgi:bifunctional enzyme CysN/CysC/sulfate adenylyltransferase subunit 1
MATTTGSGTSATFQNFLDEHLEREMLRFTTAGSVDDGKSTLIGRLLHDTKTVYEDQLASIRQSKVNRAAGPIDFSLLTDGLRAEREQGITIDVAYRYFSTSRRKFIIADTPGHEQYTRNMATGASTADLAIVLVDAGKGLLAQSRRHASIAALLGIPHVVVAINKMDTVDYDPSTYRKISADFHVLANQLGLRSVQIIPISALKGDNIVTRSARTLWYDGPTLLEHLETVPLDRLSHGEDGDQAHLRFPVQMVLRPDASFRGFAGQVARGVLRTGDEVLALPSGIRTRVASIVTYDGKLTEAFAPMPVTIQLEDEIDLSRGDMLVSPETPPHLSRTFGGKVIWLHEEPLQKGRIYIAKHTTRTVRVQATAIRSRVDMHTLAELPAAQLEMNDIGSVDFSSNLPLLFDRYAVNRALGSMILIDAVTNATVGAVMLERDLGSESRNRAVHNYPLVLTPASSRWSALVMAELRDRHIPYISLDDPHITGPGIPSAVRVAQQAGLVAVCSRDALTPNIEYEIQQFLGRDRWIEVDESPTAAEKLAEALEKILYAGEGEER